MSGLVQTAESEQEKRTPLFSKIPIIGSLFKSSQKTKENMQMVIYLVPHIEDVSISLYEKKYNSEWAKKNMERVIDLLGEL